MDYQEFQVELCLTILRKEEIAGKDVRMRDGRLYICWNVAGRDCVMQWELRKLYEEFKRRGWRSMITTIEEHFRVQYFLNAHQVMVRPLNFARSRLELEDGVYKRFGDISLVLYAALFEADEDKVMMQVSRNMVRQWKMADKLLLEEALRATCEVRPPRLYRSTDIVDMAGFEEGIFMPEECGEKFCVLGNEKEGMRGYRLTTLGHVNGAVALFYPGVLERLAELFGGDYYIGFISVHEVVVHPVQYKILQEMKAAILRANVLCDSREMLTDKVYRYCCQQGRMVEV
ncbi:MAG: hypothetical protein E7292_06735 [Lachnospiraceae bacterium]|nr:hypothetical protein [Lachnospiraceae bacterium]